MIERLLIGYEKHPEMIQCHRITNIFFDEAGNVKTSHIPYDKPTYLHKLTGCGSVLYPPHSLHEEVLREDKFMTLAPTSDDIWFWLMGVLNGRRINVVENNIDVLNYIPGTQNVGLSLINDQGENFFFKHLENKNRSCEIFSVNRKTSGVKSTSSWLFTDFFPHAPKNILNAYPVLRNILLYEQRLALGK